MSRKDILLAQIKRDGQGLEIGPSYAPIAPKKAGFRVHVLDHMNREELIQKFRPHGVNIDNIEEVDFVWDGRSYPELIGRTQVYDWIIASHAIEHTPDLIGFLNDCDAMLKNDGVLSLAIPDVRYCFDHFRPITGLARVIDAFTERKRIHSAGTAAEFILSAVTRGGQIAWDTINRGEFRLQHSLAQAQRAIRDIAERNLYRDVHEWCFTPTSFRLILRDLFELGLIQLKELAFHPTVGCEFYITLSRSGVPLKGTRLELMQCILKEQAAEWDYKRPSAGTASISVVIPALNEGKPIAKVVRECLATGLPNEIVVVDNGSTDQTADRARKAGARVVSEPRHGYGRACAAGIAALRPECDIVVFLDGDGSDCPEFMQQLVDPLVAGKYDFVIGSRTRGNREPGSMNFQQILSGRIAGRLLSILYGVRFTDMCPFRAISRSALERLSMKEETYGWNLEMQMKAARAGLRILEIPVNHRRRAGGHSKVSGTLRGTFVAGARIIATLLHVALERKRDAALEN